MQHSSVRASIFVTSLALSLAAFGCASGDAGPPAKAAPASVAKPAPAAPPGHLARVAVDRVLTEQGPPWILRRVMPREVIRDDGKFTGWQLTGLPEEWSHIDLQPGDVVTRVNGKPIETPEEAWEAWKSVARARELKISLVRKGTARELVIPIDGDLDAAAARALDNNAPPARPRSPENRGVVQIGAGAPPDEGDFDSY